MTTIITAANAAEFLSLVPHLLGFVPTRSIVLVPFARGRTVGALRFDLPATTPLDADADRAGSDEAGRVAATAVGMLCRLPHADAVAVVVYPDAVIDEHALPADEVVRGLLQRADTCGIRATEALCVAGDRWASYLDPDRPPQGHVLDTSASARAGGSIPIVQGDQTTGARLPATTRAERAAVADASRSLSAALGAMGGVRGAVASRAKTSRASASKRAAKAGRDAARMDPPALDAARRLDDLPAFYEDALGWDPAALAPFSAAALALCLSRPGMRDVALVQWCGERADGDRALDAQLRWEEGADYPAELGMRMWGEGVRPDPHRLEAALALTRNVAALAPRRQRPGPLALCGWLSWALGRSTHAELYARLATELDPEHGLAEIVLSFAATAHLPDWVFHRPASITPTADAAPAS
jgi:hypothetical protein